MDYEGAVILISHDRHLVAATADRLWLVKDGTVKSYDGDIDSYRAELIAERNGRTRGGRGDAAPDSTDKRAAATTRADQRRAAAERRAELAPLKKAMEAAERQVAKISADMAKLDAVLADSDIYTSEPERAQKAALDRGQLAKQLEVAEEAWLEAGEAYERGAADAAP